MNASRDFYDTTPGARIYESVASERWTISGALAEFVDNSFGQGMSTQVAILDNRKLRTLTIQDNGVGMDQVGALLKLASDRVEAQSATDISQFGMGGSEALVWLSWTEWAEVWSVRNGELQYFKVDWNQVAESNKFPPVSRARVSAAKAPKAIRNGGTIIRLKVRSARQPWQRPAVQRQLGGLFAPAAEFGKELVWKTAGSSRPVSLPSGIPVATGEHFVNINLRIPNPGGPELFVTGQVWYDENLKGEKGVSFSYGPRVIIQAGDPVSRHSFARPGAQAYSGRGVTGFLQLSSGWKQYLTTKKDGINDKGLQDALTAQVYDAIEETILKLSQQGKITKFLSNVTLNGRLSLDMAFHHMDVNGIRERRPGTTEPRPRPEPDPNRVIRIRTPKVTQPGDRPTDPPQEGMGARVSAPSAGAEFNVYLGSDEECQGGLALTEINPGSISVYLNRTSDVVMSAVALEDQMLLNELLAGSIAMDFLAGSGVEYFADSFDKSVVLRCGNPALEETGDLKLVSTRIAYLQKILLDALQANKS